MSYPTCSFVLTRGTLCESPALKDHTLCYYHFRDQQRKSNLEDARSLKSSDPFLSNPRQQELLNPEIIESLDIPALDDAESIQVAVTNITRAILSGHVSEKRGGLALYGCQVAAINLPRTKIRIRNFESAPVATLDPNPIAPLINTRQQLPQPYRRPATPPAAASPAANVAKPSTRETCNVQRETVSAASPSSTLETRNEKLETATPASVPAASATNVAKPSTRETGNVQRETISASAPASVPTASATNVAKPSTRETCNVQRETVSAATPAVSTPRRPRPPVNSETFAEQVKLATTLQKAIQDGYTARKRTPAARNGSAG